MNHERRHIDLRYILAKIFMPRWNAGEARVRRSNRSRVPTRLNGLLANAFSQVNIRVVEVLEELGEERVTIGAHRFLDSFEHRTVNALRIVCRLEQIRRNAADDHRLADMLRSVLSDIAGYFSAAHREADKNCVLELEVRDQVMQIFGERVVVVSGCGLTRFAESAPVIGDHAISSVEQDWYLFFPR